MVRIAMIGVGAISGIYLKNLTETFREVSLVGVCDLIPERAQKGVELFPLTIENRGEAPAAIASWYARASRERA